MRGLRLVSFQARLAPLQAFIILKDALICKALIKESLKCRRCCDPGRGGPAPFARITQGWLCGFPSV